MYSRRVAFIWVAFVLALFAPPAASEIFENPSQVETVQSKTATDLFLHPQTTPIAGLVRHPLNSRLRSSVQLPENAASGHSFKQG